MLNNLSKSLQLEKGATDFEGLISLRKSFSGYRHSPKFQACNWLCVTSGRCCPFLGLSFPICPALIFCILGWSPGCCLGCLGSVEELSPSRVPTAFPWFLPWLPTASSIKAKRQRLSLKASGTRLSLLHQPLLPFLSFAHFHSLWLLQTCPFPASRPLLRLLALLRTPFIPFTVCQKSYPARYAFPASPG